ncbi:MAG: ABC transporter permease subunit [Betaproteobacteria bacterium]|nr:MAG: ABC transporter permease subunit [Betaproteobacteria bacterium]
MIFTIAAKELRSMFASPLAWVVLAFMQFVLAFIFLKQIDGFLEVQAQLARTPNAPGLTEIAVVPMFGVASMLLLMSVPLLTMRLVSEERRNQTMALLMSAPISMTQIIIGKFVAMFAFLALINLLIVGMALSLLAGGTLDLGLLIANLTGLILLGSSFAAIGLFISCLTTHPVVAAILSLAIFLALWIINAASRDPQSSLHLISLLKRFEGFLNGTVAVTDLIFFALLTATFLILSIRRLDSERLHA